MRDNVVTSHPPRPRLPLPTPRTVEWLDGAVCLAGGFTVTGAHLATDAVDTLVSTLRRSTGLAPSDDDRGAVAIHLASDPTIPTEGYELEAHDRRITLRASTPQGFGWAVQTLLSLLPPLVLGPGPVDPEAAVMHAVRISDAPTHAWRGCMIDLARHFLPVDGLLRHIDTMAVHKLNVLHLHLTDDQGWRLPIDAYPRLTEVAAWRPGTLAGHQPPPDDRDCDDVPDHDGVPHGGYLTRADIRRIVDHARRRGITVVPEVDMPGHMEAAIAAYPELGCGHPHHPRTCWGISWHVLSLTPTTMEFCRTVLDETMDLFPGSPIHVGGDECPGEEWRTDARTLATMARVGAAGRAEAQAWFEAEVCRHVLDAGRRVIAWDEVLDADIDPAVTIQCWHDLDRADEALRRGHDLILSPVHTTYFDYDQVIGPRRPVSAGGPLTLAQTSTYGDALRRCSRDEAPGHLLGGQAQLWTEYVRSWSRAENLLWPRTASLAEQLWTGGPSTVSTYEDLREHCERLSALEVAWCRNEELRAD